MSTAEFLAKLRERGVELTLEGGKLRCSAPAGTLTAALRDELGRRKPEIMEFIRSARALAGQQRAIVPIQGAGSREPVFAVPGHNGDVFCYRALARALGPDQPFYGLQPPGADGQGEPLRTVDELAAYLAAQVGAFLPDGPLIVAGFCAGGTIAFELGRRLDAAGRSVSFIALFGSPYPAQFGLVPQLKARLVKRAVDCRRHVRALSSLAWHERTAYVFATLGQRGKREPAGGDATLSLRAKVENATLAAVRRYSPTRFPGRLVMILPSRGWALANQASLWREAARCTEELFGPEGCDHDSMLRPSHAEAFAELFRSARDSAPEQALAAPSTSAVRRSSSKA